jgi:rhomboid protease GluP
MDVLLILFWTIGLSAFSSFIAAIKRRPAADGWAVVSLTILILLFLSWLRESNLLIYVAAAIWAVSIVVPSILVRSYQQRMIQQQYGEAHRLARAIAFLHPFDGWRQQPMIVHALDLANRGDVAKAVEMLNQFQHLNSPAAHTAMIHLVRITNRWEEFLEWVNQFPPEFKTNPQLLPLVLRALGEIGDLHGLVDLYSDCRSEIAKLSPATNRDSCRLALFAFSGRRDLVERLLDGPLSLLPDGMKVYWLATARMVCGDTESARRELESQLSNADPSTRRAIERRLSKPLSTAASLDRERLQIVEEAAVEHTHEEIFQAAPPLNAARATILLIALNVLMFAAEIHGGGATNEGTLINLGAMFGPAVHAGQWWRLFTALFLHFGALHIICNMVNLSVVGPFAERAFGFVIFMCVYFAAGLGSMWMDAMVAHHHFTVGASGAIMGLVGATGGLMLKGWLQERAHPAKRGLRMILMVLAIQSAFDITVPQVSMTAHLSGALIGFATALLLPNRLISESRRVR